MKLGVVGLPNVGKSTLFNAITHAGAECANYPFCTIEPNVGVVAVPDERLDKLAALYNSKKINGHAGICETAFIMGSDPQTVHLDRLGIESGLPTGKSEKYSQVGLGMYGQWGMDVPNWFEGHDPDGVNERIGKAAVRLEAERLARGIKILKEDTYLEEFQLSRA